jgi:hypothetical protein
MGGEPFSDLPNAKFSFGDGFGNKFVGRNSLQLEIVPVDPEKGIGHREADTLVVIEGRMIVCKRFHEGRGFMEEIVVVAVLRTENRRFEQTLVAEPVNAPKFVDELTVNLDGLPTVR